MMSQNLNNSGMHQEEIKWTLMSNIVALGLCISGEIGKAMTSSSQKGMKMTNPMQTCPAQMRGKKRCHSSCCQYGRDVAPGAKRMEEMCNTFCREDGEKVVGAAPHLRM